MTVRLAGVFAHPDDDSYVIGGTLLLHPGDIDLTLVFATSGEAGPISDPALATRETLGRVRETEQRAFLGAVGYEGADVHFLRHPDYYLPEVPFEDIVREVETILRGAAPHVVVTFGPEGMTSHHDHIRSAEAATEAFHRARRGSSEGAFRWLYHAALGRSDVDRFYRGVREGGFDYGEEGRLFDITGVPDDHIAVRVDTRAVRERKWEAICRHRTQMDEHERIPEPLRWIVLDSESFVQAHPTRGRGGPVRPDLIEDVSPMGVPEPRR
jgi:LmbE family N-acetylglucosaminyl deacetylase